MSINFVLNLILNEVRKLYGCDREYLSFEIYSWIVVLVIIVMNVKIIMVFRYILGLCLKG